MYQKEKHTKGIGQNHSRFHTEVEVSLQRTRSGNILAPLCLRRLFVARRSGRARKMPSPNEGTKISNDQRIKKGSTQDRPSPKGLQADCHLCWLLKVYFLKSIRKWLTMCRTYAHSGGGQPPSKTSGGDPPYLRFSRPKILGFYKGKL